MAGILRNKLQEMDPSSTAYTTGTALPVYIEIQVRRLVQQKTNVNDPKIDVLKQSLNAQQVKSIEQLIKAKMRSQR